MAKLLTREMSRAQVNNCVFFFSVADWFLKKNDNWRVYGVTQIDLVLLTIFVWLEVLLHSKFYGRPLFDKEAEISTFYH